MKFNIKLELDPAEEGFLSNIRDKFKKSASPTQDTSSSKEDQTIPSFHSIDEGLEYALSYERDNTKHGFPKFHLEKYKEVIWMLYPYQHMYKQSPEKSKSMTQRAFSNVESQLPLIEKRLRTPKNETLSFYSIEFDWNEKRPDMVNVTYFFGGPAISGPQTDPPIRPWASIEDCPYGIADSKKIRRYTK